jgi:hypothetical protein
LGNEGDGGQAEFTRVPQADGTLVAVPGSDFSDETLASLLTLSDVMGTGYHAAVSAGVKQGDTKDRRKAPSQPLLSPDPYHTHQSRLVIRHARAPRDKSDTFILA